MAAQNPTTASLSSIFAELKAALEHDDKKEYQQAFTRYLTTQEKIIQHFKKFQFAPRDVQIETQLWKYYRETIDRAEHIRNGSSSSPAASPAGPSPPSPSNVNQPRQQPATIVAAPQQQSFVVQQTNGAALPQSLSLIRRKHEEEQLKMLRSQLVSQQQQRLLEEQKRQQLKKVSSWKLSMQNRARRFRKGGPQDRWTQFIDRNLQYDKMDPDLLYQDQTWLEQLNTLREQLIRNVTAGLEKLSVADAQRPAGPVSASAFSAPASDASFSKELNECVSNHLAVILGPSQSRRQHSLLSCLVAFKQEFSAELAQQQAAAGRSEEDLRAAVSHAIQEVHSFIDRLLGVMLQLYWISDALDSDAGENCLHSIIQRVIYSGPNGLFERLKAMVEDMPSVRDRNTLIRIKLQELRGQPVHSLGIDVEKFPRLQDGLDNNAYQQSILELRKLDSGALCVPDDMTDSLLLAIQYLSDSAQQAISADDLLPIFSYVLLKASPSCFASTLALVELSLSDYNSSGAYALATADTAARYLVQLHSGGY